MKKTGKIAVGGIISALSISFMFLTAVLPFFTYVFPICAGILMIVVNEELGRIWGISVYFTVSILSILIVADKEAALIYIAFFGYYPIIKEKIERLNKALAYIIKLLIFNASTTISYYLMIKLFGLSAEEFNEFGKYTIPILLGLANILFFLTDWLLNILISLYKKQFQARFHKMFK